ncbi:hypothetical protein BDQ17DRAFT_1421799 [Cyathus striatus]|nr:hypothetical protein BDQ17DRAFT_1421799 [Cyathus striatus]
MTVLITGGTGNTGLKLARLLRNASIPVLITSRSGSAPDSFPAVRFDWFDSSTFSAPFEKDTDIDKIYFVGPRNENMLSIAKPFIDLAVEKGVKQWVILGGSQGKKGGKVHGAVHQYLDEKDVDHTMLRSAWFQENFSTQFLHSIKTRNEIMSAVGNGHIPFVSSSDIAQAAFEVLTTDSKELKNCEPYVVGPELFTYDETATLLSETLGRTITHRRIPFEEVHKFWVSIGLAEDTAARLARLETNAANGSDEACFNAEDRKEIKFTGKKTLRQYFEENKDIWVPA